MLNTFKLAMMAAAVGFAWSLAWLWFPMSKQPENYPWQHIAAQQATPDPQCYIAGTLGTGNIVRFETMMCVHRDGTVKELPIR